MEQEESNGQNKQLPNDPENVTTYYVAIKFIDDKEKSHVIVTSDKVLKFDPEQTERNKYKNPYYVLKYDNEKEKELTMPANILDHSTVLDEVQNPPKRYKYPKCRFSDAVQKLADEASDCSEDDDVSTKNKLKGDGKTSKKGKQNKKTATSSTVDNDNEEDKLDNIQSQLDERQMQRDLIKRKACQVLADDEAKRTKMDVVLTSYKLNLSSSSEHETSLVTENNEEIETQLDRLKKQNFFLSKRIEEKDKELEKLQLSIVMLRSKVESLEKEVDETYNLLNLCTKTNEELKKQLSASKSEENQKSKLDDFSAQFQSPLSTKSASLPSKHLFHDNITSSPQNSSFSNRCLTDDIVHCKSPSPSSESLKLYSTPKVTGQKNKSGIVNTPSTKGCTANISEQKINKKKDKGKKKLIKHSLYDYDSDDYANDLKMDDQQSNMMISQHLR